MQIAFFTNNYLPVTNGVVRSVSTFRKTFTRMGHNVFVFAQEDDVEDQDPFIFRYPSLPLPVPVDIAAAIPISPNIDWLLPHLKLDVIHTHHPVLLGSVAAHKARRMDLPLVFTFHTQYHEYTHYFPLPQEAVQEFLKEAVYDYMRAYMHRCHHIVVPSESMLALLLRDYGLETNYTVVPTGIDLQPYQDAEGSLIREKHGWGEDTLMISVGRLAKEKNWQFLLRSASEVMQDRKDFRLVILGEGPERKNLQEYADELGIRRWVDFIGQVSFEQVPAYLKAADLFGFASTTETQGLVTLEALAAGLPVVAVDASGTRDIVRSGVQGFLVPEDEAAFSQAVANLIDHPETYQQFKQAALARAADFEISAMAQLLLEVYQLAAEEHQAENFVRVADS